MAPGAKLDVAFDCPVPLAAKDSILLGHGSGGRLSEDLLRNIILPALANPVLERLDDQAIVDVGGSRLAFTTDSFVVKPLFFPGGDIGTLGVNGTVNDLAMGGAQALFLSLALILEEGLPLGTLRLVMESIRAAAAVAGVAVVTGDTKVVEKGSVDGLFVNTSGIGIVPSGVRLSADQARPGDRVLLSGTIGDHGITILSQREGLGFESGISSDTAALHTLVADMLRASSEIRCLRDPTRGGLSSSLHEIAARSRVGIELEENTIPVREEVRGACEMPGPSIPSTWPTKASWSRLSGSRRPKRCSKRCAGIRSAATDGSLERSRILIRRWSPCEHGSERRGSSICSLAISCRESAEGVAMHEMGIASAVLDAVRAETRRFPDGHICKVGVRIGELAGVDPDSVSFCFEVLVRGTELELPELRRNTARAAINVSAVDTSTPLGERSRRVRTAV